MDRLNYHNAKTFYGFVRYTLHPWTGFYTEKWYEVQKVYFVDHSIDDIDYHKLIQFALAYQDFQDKEWGDNGDEPSWTEWLNSTIAAYNIRRRQVLNRLRELWIDSKARDDVTMFMRYTMLQYIARFFECCEETTNMPIYWHDEMCDHHYKNIGPISYRQFRREI